MIGFVLDFIVATASSVILSFDAGYGIGRNGSACLCCKFVNWLRVGSLCVLTLLQVRKIVCCETVIVTAALENWCWR